MSRHRILELGAGPADEPCAQLGQCADFAEANTLELLAYKAAIIALNCEPPLPLGFALIANAHDFGTYRTLWLVSAEMPLPESAQAWLDDLVEPATWIAAGFPQPVTYEGSRAVRARTIEALRAVGDTPRRLDLLPTKPLPRSDG